MTRKAFSPRRALLALALGAALGAPLGLATVQPALAQAVVAVVNHEPITSFDIDQRVKILAVTERRRLDRGTALRELVDDKVKLIEARRLGYRVTDDGLEGEFAKVAKGNRMTVREFESMLERSGINPSALRQKMRAELAWVVLVRDQARRGAQVTNDEITRAVDEETKKSQGITDFHIRQVVFIVPRGSADIGARERAASAARAKFSSCETGFAELETMRDVAVQPLMVRGSDALSKPLTDLLNKTAVGRLTPPQRGSQGIEMIAVCEKKARTSSGALRSDIAVNLSEKKAEANAKTYLETLRKKVQITYRR